MTLFDPGLQPERTELAWRRTALSIGLGSLVAMRVLPAALGVPATALLGACGVLASAALWRLARRRYRDAGRALTAGAAASMPDGTLPGLLALFTTVIGAVGVAVAVAASLQH